ncbi:MAG TPA: YkgJ family cysteine cluster protein [Desulfuromonadaceae bacterium]
MSDTTTDDASWDSRCKQCGRCCYDKLEDSRGRIIYTGDTCRYLDVETHRCKIFKRRFEINPHCMKLTPELVETLSWLPVDCGYRPPAPKYTRKTNRSRRK